MRRRSAGRSAIIPPKFTAPASSEDESEAAAEESIPQERVEKQKPDPRPSLLALDDEERAFVLALSYDPVPIDTLVTDIRTVKKVLSLATSLEIKGFVTRYPGNRIGLKAE
ncbi:hypothetical protein SDC9_144401 [bioreactor metagenome]|uniref:DprA winged helix domain-containing protein n=1 Tax=bioreactor metagenome TaxID=1076179 RepID=A0A645E7M5_9ZZZZ